MSAHAAFEEARLTELVRERGLGDDASAHRAILATLQAFGSRVPAPERDALARALPRKLARAIAAERFRGAGTARDVYAAVERAERVRPGYAHEHVQIVLGALGELLPEELDDRVEEAVAPSIAELLRGFARSDGDSPPYAEVHSPRHRTLATGKPGSAHPLSESAPPGPQTESVGAENPHEDTKLSSARGESLADARPDASRTIAARRE